jgi:hypothetical protein
MKKVVTGVWWEISYWYSANGRFLLATKYPYLSTSIRFYICIDTGVV